VRRPDHMHNGLFYALYVHKLSYGRPVYSDVMPFMVHISVRRRDYSPTSTTPPVTLRNIFRFSRIIGVRIAY